MQLVAGHATMRDTVSGISPDRQSIVAGSLQPIPTPNRRLFHMTLRTHCMNVLVVFLMPATLSAQEYKSGVEWQEPPVVTPGAVQL